jgi:hypothetical protein
MMLLSADICSINTEKSARNAWETNIKLQNRGSIIKDFHSNLKTRNKGSATNNPEIV